MKRLSAGRTTQTATEQAFLEAFIESIPDMVWAKDVAGVFLTCNPVVESFYGVPRDQIIGKTDYDFADADLADHFRAKDQAAMDAASPQINHEWLTFASDGRTRLFETMKTPMRDGAGNVLGILGVARDVTEHHAARLAQESLNRALKLIGKCNHAMMHAADESRLLSEVCQLAVDVGGYLMAWVGFVEHDERKTVLPVSWSRGCRTLLDRIEVSWAETELGQGPSGTAIRRGATVVNQDYGVDPSIRPWREVAADYGFRSSASIPLIHDGAAFGVMVIYSGKTGAFGAAELHLLEEMTADLAYGIQTLRTRAEHEVAKRKLEFFAHHDALTGTPNRLLLRDRFERASAGGNGARDATAILLLDLDNFKAVNDSLGHDCGDELLVEVTRRLQQSIGEHAVVCRYGGDEFVILLTGVKGPAEVTEFVGGLTQSFIEPFVVGEYPIDVTFSIGVSLYPADATTLDELIKFADTALQRSKETGKNNFLFFNEGMKSDAQEQVLLRAQLNNAVRSGELVLHYQPKIDLGSGVIVGAEALVRWQHPERGLLGPDAFIPFAEKTGLIIPLGEWVLDQACAQAAAWKALGLPLQSVSINISALQVRRGNLLGSVVNALERNGLTGSDIELELTESIFLQKLDASLRLLQNLRQLGVKLSIDDFGTGYSSLAYLKQLRVDRLKIDRSFIRDIPGNSDSTAIVKTIIQLAQNLDLAVTAEGVESEAQLGILEDLGCDEAQGYLISRPIDAAAFAQLFISRHETEDPPGANDFAVRRKIS